MLLYFRFCHQNSMKMSLSTCSEFGLQVNLLNYMKRAVLYMFASLSIEKCNPGMSVCSFDLLFTKLFLNVYPLLLWKVLGLVSESKIFVFNFDHLLISKRNIFQQNIIPGFSLIPVWKIVLW